MVSKIDDSSSVTSLFYCSCQKRSREAGSALRLAKENNIELPEGVQLMDLKKVKTGNFHCWTALVKVLGPVSWIRPTWTKTDCYLANPSSKISGGLNFPLMGRIACGER